VGFIINEAARVVVKNVVTYEVIITQGKTTDTLVYDQNSNFIRNISQRDSLATVQKKKK
jgi:2-C-methyl-D-erythritol 4-phosphate cytidylyltransferase